MKSELKEAVLGFGIGAGLTILIVAAMILWAAPKIDFTEDDMCIDSSVQGCVLSPYPGARAKP